LAIVALASPSTAVVAVLGSVRLQAPEASTIGQHKKSDMPRLDEWYHAAFRGAGACWAK
jgi:hypothetical protein